MSLIRWRQLLKGAPMVVSHETLMPVPSKSQHGVLCCTQDCNDLFEVWRVCKPGGLALLLCASERFRQHIRAWPWIWEWEGADEFVCLRRPPDASSQLQWCMPKGCPVASLGLIDSFVKNHFANGSPAVHRLEQEWERKCPGQVAVIAVCNATVGLSVLVDAYAAKATRWAVQSFTFWSDIENSLRTATVLPMRSDGHCGPDVCDWSALDGLLVTTCFNMCPLRVQREYVDAARRAGKVILFDHATLMDPTGAELGDGYIVSLHETKPIGRGEGGLIVVPKHMESAVRALVAFGTSPERRRGTNAKMSDFSAAPILAWWHLWDTWVREAFLARRRALHDEIDRRGLQRMFPAAAVAETDPHCIVLTHPGPLSDTTPIPLRRYYEPVCGSDPVANALFRTSVCIPILPCEDWELYLKTLDSLK